jgi:hypothetical protein
MDMAGNTASGSTQIPYDATAPAVEAKAERGPDKNGWYNRAVTVSFNGNDATSGVASCAAPVLYKGPDTPKTSVSGTCQDKAANTSPPAGYDLRYDTKPPVLGRLRTEVTNRGVVLRWTASKDTLSVTVVRRPGLRGRKLSTVYDGKARAFTDRDLKKGVKYRYTVTAYDEAGNGAAKGLAVKSAVTTSTRAVPTRTAGTSALTRPRTGARLDAPPVLAWRAVAKATYYNVQLYRGGQKILTAWPEGTTYRVQSTWRFDGRAYKLTPGTYRWYVWPGFGQRKANRYGKLLGTRTFVVTR